MSMFKLDGTNIVPITENEEAREAFEADRQVALTNVSEEVLVSTVFLVYDHNFFDSGPPLVFETMIFGGEKDGELHRASSWNEAVKQHQTTVNELIDS